MKNKDTEFTANVAMTNAPANLKIGRNFAKPIPRLAKQQQQKSFLQKLFSKR